MTIGTYLDPFLLREGNNLFVRTVCRQIGRVDEQDLW